MDGNVLLSNTERTISNEPAVITSGEPRADTTDAELKTVTSCVQFDMGSEDVVETIKEEGSDSDEEELQREPTQFEIKKRRYGSKVISKTQPVLQSSMSIAPDEPLLGKAVSLGPAIGGSFVSTDAHTITLVILHTSVLVFLLVCRVSSSI